MTTPIAELVADDVAVERVLAQLLDTPPTAVLVVVDCDTCGRYGKPMSLAEAESQGYAGTHDDLHHGGAPTAYLRIYQS